MKKINSSLRVTELDTLSDVIVRIYKDAASDEDSLVAKDTNLSGVMAEVEKLSADITTAIKSDKATSALDEADIERDEVIRNISDALTGYAAIPVASKKSAAEELLPIFNKYGRQITAKNYAEESSLIESLLEDFGRETPAADIASLEGVPELVSSLREAQDAFNKANDDYTAAKTSRGDSATAVKKSLVSTLNDKLVPYLTAVGALSGYKDFVSKVESEVDKANAIITARSSNKKTETKS